MSIKTYKLSRLSILIGCLVLPLQLSATPSEFKQAYKAYNEAFESGNTEQAAKSAKQAYDLGKVIYGETSIDTANLGFNLAISLANNYEFDQADPYFADTLDLYKIHFGEDSVQLVDPLLTYADKTKNISKLFQTCSN